MLPPAWCVYVLMANTKVSACCVVPGGDTGTPSEGGADSAAKDAGDQ